MNWKDIVAPSIPFLRWYDHMWIMSIPLLFLSAPQVFPKFLLNSHTCQNQSIRFCKPDCPVLVTGYVRPLNRILVNFFGLSSNLPGHVRPLSKKYLKLYQNLLFGFISSIYLDLCDHVKILQCLNEKWIINKEVMSWTISL
jgi:hypothetical protein